jgi:2-polyprenyl-3-methyl-5-hydroxy-6-metoxy-1,4-benzoquinol methylase
VIEGSCKICGSSNLSVFAHTARCEECGVLLYWPYPKSDTDLMLEGNTKRWPRERALWWYQQSSFHNHTNFTQMLRFTMSELPRDTKLDILDYGGGGGQFALVCSSHFPCATVYITDISDESLLEEWKHINRQISFRDFADDTRKFDVIFLNDVFEHVSDPVSVLKQLTEKLTRSGIIFIDTPKQFWLYPVTKLISTALYSKLLNATVSKVHLQIWSKKSFELVIKQCGLKIEKYEEISEYTMPAHFYLDNMEIENPIIRFVGGMFYRSARYIAKNKIICVLSV